MRLIGNHCRNCGHMMHKCRCNPLSNKEVLALLRIGLEEETDLPVPVLADADSATPGGEVRESNPKTTAPVGPDSRGGQFISPTNRGLFMLATLP